MRYLEAFAWAVLCAAAVAAGGFFANLVGSRLYPQRYEQFPVEILFIPLGLILGWMAGATARLVRPPISIAAILGVVALSTIVYGSFTFQFARSNAVPARLSVSFEPDPGIAVSCNSTTCPDDDPPLQWIVEGHLQVQETAGLGGTVEGIEISSSPKPLGRPHTFTAAEAAEQKKFASPNIHLTGRQIPGPRHLRPNEIVSYPIRYFYRDQHGDSERIVGVIVQFTDGVGRRAKGGAGQWKVQ